jgi:hypothetical protein
MKQIWRAIKIEDKDRLTCQQCQNDLPEYLLAHITQDPVRWRDVELHLTICPICSEEYDDLRELREAADGRLGSDPQRWPSPNMSFLRPPPVAPPPPNLLSEISRVVIEIRRALQLPQSQNLAPEGRRSGIRRLEIEDSGEDLAVKVDIQQMPNDPTQCIISVDAQIPSRGGWPNLGGTQVTLKRHAQELKIAETNPFGEVVFEGIDVEDLPNLAIVVKPSP